MYVYIFKHTCAWIFVYGMQHVYIYIYIYIHTHIYIYACVCIVFVRGVKHVYVCMYACMYIYIYACVCMNIYTWCVACIYTYRHEIKPICDVAQSGVSSSMYICVRAFTYTRYTYTHTYSYTHTRSKYSTSCVNSYTFVNTNRGIDASSLMGPHISHYSPRGCTPRQNFKSTDLQFMNILCYFVQLRQISVPCRL